MQLELGKKNFIVFKDCINLLKAINEELTLHISEEQILTRGMDPSHVAMVEAKIKAGLFDRFESSEGSSKITVNLTEFAKFLDRVDKDESVKISYKEEEARLVIQTRKGGRRRRFSLPVLEPLDEEVPEPKISFKSSGRILTKSVDMAIKDADLVSEFMKIMFTEDMMRFDATGDVGSARNEFDKGSDELLELKVEEEASANFTLSYLADIFGQLKNLAEVVTLELTTDMPLKVEAEPNDQNLEIKFYLAPMIGV